MIPVSGTHLGVLLGLKSEAAFLRKYLPGDFEVTVGISGARIDQARREVARLVDGGATHLLSFGYAGGIDPAYPAGTLLLPTAIRTVDGDQFDIDPAWRDRIGLALDGAPTIADPVVGSDHIVATAADKASLHRRFKASAVDMESHILAAAAKARGLPMLVIRVLLDPADRALPPAASASVTAAGGISPFALIGSLLRQPGQLPSLIALGRLQATAQAALLGCGRRCGPIGFGVR